MIYNVQLTILILAFSEIGISPLRMKRVNKRDHAGYVKGKIRKMQTTVAEKTASVSGLSSNEILPLTSTKVQCENCIDYSSLILELKKKWNLSTTGKKCCKEIAKTC